MMSKRPHERRQAKSRKGRIRKDPFAVSPALWAEVSAELDHLLSDVGGVTADYLRLEWKRKLLDPNQVTADERKSAAISKWLKIEERNARTNQRLLLSPLDEGRILGGISLHSVIAGAQRIIRDTIGDTPSLEASICFTGGASTSVKRGSGSIARKLLSGRDVTEEAWPHVSKLINHAREVTLGNRRVWEQLREWDNPVFVPGNELFTVPKSTEIDRCAAKEPDLNMLIQKALGNAIRKALRRKGVDLNDQTRNQRLAHEGSAKGTLATIDLSSASDSVTTQLVYILLPLDWAAMLDDCRSKHTLIGDAWHENEMFSSMGNAFTFELESLIFWALARASARYLGVTGSISVFGDDIICPVAVAKPLVRVLGYCGFQANAKKSFWSGPFRESCGKHYHAGVDITPFYVKELPLSVPRWIHLGNSLRKWLALADPEVLDPRFYAIWQKIAAVVPRPLWGGYDYSSIENLVAPSIRPIARIRKKIIAMRGETESLQTGLYLQWLATADEGDRTNPVWRESALKERIIDPIGDKEAEVTREGDLQCVRVRADTWKAFWEPIARFPQEWGVYE
jgi:hypothetical protein